MLDNLKRPGARVGFPLLACLLWAQGASAETVLVEKDGWTFYANGRVGAFLSISLGDDFPKPTEPLPPAPGPDPTIPGQPNPGHQIGGVGSSDFGWASNYQRDEEGKVAAMRVRSGTVSNVLGFGLKHAISPTTTINGYIAIWAPIESIGRDKWRPVDADVREGYFQIDGSFGSFAGGRLQPLFGRTSFEVDQLYGHGFGVGFPCIDEVGPTCGQVGLGAIDPGFAAGFTYSTPSLGGLRLHAGAFDPVRFYEAPSLSGGVPYEKVPFLRPEGAVTFDAALGGSGKLKLGVEGGFQPVSVIADEDADNNPATPDVSVETSHSIWGVSAGARLEVGPARIGGAFFHGKGTGIYNTFDPSGISGGPALKTVAGVTTLDPTKADIRSFTGFHAQLAGVFGKVEVGVGGGVASVGRVDSDDRNFHLSAPKQQMGVGAHVNYRLTEYAVIGIDYMRMMARWYGAPAAVLDAAGQPGTNGQVLAAEKQDVNFLNAGVTFHW
jgi:hypothetical protein